MPITLDTYNADHLEPAIYPETAFTIAAKLGASGTYVKGQVLAAYTPDGKLYAYDNTNTSGLEKAVAILKHDVVTDAAGNHYLGTNAVPSSVNLPLTDVPVYIAGCFLESDLTDYDADTAADFNARDLLNGIISIPL
jgi:hypothetical protein